MIERVVSLFSGRSRATPAAFDIRQRKLKIENCFFLRFLKATSVSRLLFFFSFLRDCEFLRRTSLLSSLRGVNVIFLVSIIGARPQINLFVFCHMRGGGVEEGEVPRPLLKREGRWLVRSQTETRLPSMV